MSVSEFLRLLSELNSAGQEFLEACTSAFLENISSPDSLERSDRVGIPDRVKVLWNDLEHLFAKYSFQDSASLFLSHVRSFYEEFLWVAIADMKRICNPLEAANQHHRTLSYLDFLGMLKTSGLNVVEFCASYRPFSYFANALGHKALSTDIGGFNQEESYGFGAKHYIRSHFLGASTVDYTLDHRDFAKACSVRWFNDGVDVLAVHGTDICVGTCMTGTVKALDLKRSVFDVVKYVKPCVALLRRKGGLLSLRHVSLFRNYGEDIREELSHMLQLTLEQSLGVRVLLCGIDPLASPWRGRGPGFFDYALVIRCGQ
jgi:hypothetical protein